jgi:quercetin dioxygenase-like cupin family protein
VSASYPPHFLPLAEQPQQTDIRLMSATFVKEIRVALANTALPQHSHAYDHVSVIVRGAVRLFRDQVHIGDFRAPWAVLIPAHTKHLFVTLADDTAILCVHDGEMEFDEEHELEVTHE